MRKRASGGGGCVAAWSRGLPQLLLNTVSSDTGVGCTPSTLGKPTENTLKSAYKESSATVTTETDLHGLTSNYIM